MIEESHEKVRLIKKIRNFHSLTNDYIACSRTPLSIL